MMRFAHMADCHLGAWRIPQLQELNLESFRRAIDICIKNGVDFILISGDLFDSAYPPIETLKETFAVFKKLKESKISCYIIAGSHDYSASGKTFLDVLEKAGFCHNVYNPEYKEDKIILNPKLHENIAIYGYPGKKSSMEIEELKKVALQDAPGLFKILMLHTTITEAKGSIPADSVDIASLSRANYYALGHLHIDFINGNCIYPGPVFPNSFTELEDLKYGGFYIVEIRGEKTYCEKKDIKIKDIFTLTLEIKDAISATEKIISELNKHDLNDKIVLLRAYGKIDKGKIADIRFSEIESFAKKKNAFAFLKNTSEITTEEPEIDIETTDMESLEEEIINKFSKENPSKFNSYILQLMNSLAIEKQEDEKTAVFEKRIMDELKEIFDIKLED